MLGIGFDGIGDLLLPPQPMEMYWLGGCHRRYSIEQGPFEQTGKHGGCNCGSLGGGLIHCLNLGRCAQ